MFMPSNSTPPCTLITIKRGYYHLLLQYRSQQSFIFPRVITRIWSATVNSLLGLSVNMILGYSLMKSLTNYYYFHLYCLSLWMNLWCDHANETTSSAVLELFTLVLLVSRYFVNNKAQTASEQAFHLGDVVRSQVQVTHTFSLALRYGELTRSLSNALVDWEAR